MPESAAPPAFAPFQAIAKSTTAPARSAGAKEDCWSAVTAGLAPYMSAARTPSAAPASRASPLTAAARANGSDTKTDATAAVVVPSRGTR